MKLLLDHNVPVSVAGVFRKHGHEVKLVSDILPTDAPDPVIARISETDGLVLVSADADFRKMIQKVAADGQKAKFRKLSLISLLCSEYQSAERVDKGMSLIQAEWEVASAEGQRMHLHVMTDGYKTHR